MKKLWLFFMVCLIALSIQAQHKQHFFVYTYHGKDRPTIGLEDIAKDSIFIKRSSTISKTKKKFIEAYFNNKKQPKQFFADSKAQQQFEQNTETLLYILSDYFDYRTREHSNIEKELCFFVDQISNFLEHGAQMTITQPYATQRVDTWFYNLDLLLAYFLK